MVAYPVIVGPTAGGKSALAMAVARAMADHGRRAEIISADSIQIYRGMDIGSAKPSQTDRDEVPHHLIDVVEPTQRFSVAQWLEQAEAALAQIRSRGAVPIVVGGTMLYVKAFLEGLFDGPAPTPLVRETLAAMTPEARRAELARVDPEAAARIHPNDQRRTIRALEVYRTTGQPISAWQRQWDAARIRPGARLIGLLWPTAEVNRRINARITDMIRHGLVEEAQDLWKSGRLGPTACEALGYKQLIEYFEGRRSLEEAVEAVKIETRRFAKNQRTWLRRLRATPESVWIEAAKTPQEGWPRIALDAVEFKPP